MVEPQLGADRKPVYAGKPKTPTTTGRANFDEWFRDVPGVNQGVFVTLPFQDRGGGLYTYDNSEFFPIDGMMWGNEGHPHNYHFTFELHTRFQYRGGEVFHFRGDDDVFTFINGKQVVDLGGIHLPEEVTVNLDEQAARLGLERGQSYELDFFFAERHLTMSNFRIDTTLFFTDCTIIIP
jgi:fibro-slime domain-containing protein